MGFIGRVVMDVDDDIEKLAEEFKVNAMEIFLQVMEDVRNDPETKRLAEEYQRLYGTLTEEDLRMQFTI